MPVLEDNPILDYSKEDLFKEESEENSEEDSECETLVCDSSLCSSSDHLQKAAALWTLKTSECYKVPQSVGIG